LRMKLVTSFDLEEIRAILRHIRDHAETFAYSE